MSQRGVFWALLPDKLRRLPADLTALLGWVIFVNLAVFLPVVRETPLRVVLGLPFVLFIPGYALIAALFPEAGESPTESESEQATAATDGSGTISDRGIDGIERVALSFGLSIAVVPLIGLVLNFTPWGIRLVPIMVAVSGFTVGMTALAASRRWALPPEDQFSVPYRAWVNSVRTELFEPTSRTDSVLNVILVLSVLLAVGSVGYAVAVPKEGESFSEFYLLMEDDSGELVADGYPTDFQRGEPQELVVGVGNQEHETVDYTVVAEIQRVDIVDNETRIQETTELRRFQTTVQNNETWQRQHTVAPRMTGERLRLQYLLYRGDPGQQLNRSDAYRELHLWVNVTG
jgi:uncharacterized membrane protein